jgi:hypothetical protein
MSRPGLYANIHAKRKRGGKMRKKFRVYPSAYANAYASKICAGKIKDPSGVKRKDFRGSKAEGGLMEATAKLKRQGLKNGSVARGCGAIMSDRKKKTRMV